MVQFFLEGGVGMVPVLIFGLLLLTGAVAFARQPDERRFAIARALSSATAFATLAGFAASIGAVLHKVPANEKWARSPDLHLIVMTGLGESTAPLILGFALLALGWFIVGIGWRRLPDA